MLGFHSLRYIHTQHTHNTHTYPHPPTHPPTHTHTHAHTHTRTHTSGVPQGSVLGHSYFLLFINDIDNNIQSPLRLFADNTILYREIWSKDDHNIIQNDIQTLFKWSQTWKLDFNVSKCKILTISNKKDPAKFKYTLNNDPLEHVNSHQYLGITINSNIRWNTHASAITTKATRTLNVIRRTPHPCNPEVKKVAYMSLVRPNLEYSSAAWNPHTHKMIRHS